jgi:hypothetical protein
MRWDESAVARHNDEVAQLWRDFEAGAPARVPVVFNFSRRFYLLTPWLNERGWSFQQYFERPEVQWDVQLRLQQWIRGSVSQDHGWGLPAQWGGVAPDFQNSYEAAWLGCPLVYFENEVPTTRPILRDDKGRLASFSIPDPLRGGIMARAMEFHQYFEARRQRETFLDRPVGASWLCAGGTDGPFTVACNLRGTTELCLDLYEDPRFVRELLGFVTEAILARLPAVAAFNGDTLPAQSWGFADDSVQLLSVAQYRDVVLPYHRRLVDAFSRGGPNSIHLCGNVPRLLPVIQQELNVQDFDLGFPTDLGQARRTLGPQALLRGNLHPHLLRDGPPSLIREKVAEIMASGAKEGRRFILCEGNNVAPGTPPEHFAAAYEAAREFGRH